MAINLQLIYSGCQLLTSYSSTVTGEFNELTGFRRKWYGNNEVLSWHFPGWLRKAKENLNKDIHVPVEIQTGTSEIQTRNVTMKNAVFWDMSPCGIFINRRFGGTCRLHLQGRRNMQARKCVRRLLTD
jgi:hypothetical protein